jgi:anti-anti-sigma factor
MQLTILSDDGTLLRLQAEGEISQQSFDDGSDPLGPLLAPIGGFARKVVINLDRTSLIDSSGISWLLITNKHFIDHGGRLVFHSVPPFIQQVLQVVRLTLIMNFVADEATARAVALEGKKP